MAYPRSYLRTTASNFLVTRKTWDILHKTISHQSHQLNGLAERSVQIVKRTLSKARLNSEGHFLAMLSLNSQPDQNGTSAAEKLFGHKLKQPDFRLNHLTKVSPPKNIPLPKTYNVNCLKLLQVQQ